MTAFARQRTGQYMIYIMSSGQKTYMIDANITGTTTTRESYLTLSFLFSITNIYYLADGFSKTSDGL